MERFGLSESAVGQAIMQILAQEFCQDALPGDRVPPELFRIRDKILERAKKIDKNNEPPSPRRAGDRINDDFRIRELIAVLQSGFGMLSAANNFDDFGIRCKTICNILQTIRERDKV